MSLCLITNPNIHTQAPVHVNDSAPTLQGAVLVHKLRANSSYMILHEIKSEVLSAIETFGDKERIKKKKRKGTHIHSNTLDISTVL